MAEAIPGFVLARAGDLIGWRKYPNSCTQSLLEALIGQFHPTAKLQQAQRSLFSALKKRWKLYAQDLLPCYDIPGLPQDNLQ